MCATKRARSRSGIQKRFVCQGLRRFFSDTAAPSRDRRWQPPVSGPTRWTTAEGSSVVDPPAECCNTMSPVEPGPVRRAFWGSRHPTVSSARASGQSLLVQTAAGCGPLGAATHLFAPRCTSQDGVPLAGLRRPTAAHGPNEPGERVHCDSARGSQILCESPRPRRLRLSYSAAASLPPLYHSPLARFQLRESNPACQIAIDDLVGQAVPAVPSSSLILGRHSLPYIGMEIVDAYAHCGLSKYEPIEKVRAAMAAGGVSRAVLVQHL